jgi:predicted NBD/HSP70 family sugar kinase
MSSSTIGLDLGGRWSRYCILDQDGAVVEEDRVRTNTIALEQKFQRPTTQIVVEAGTLRRRGPV